MKKLINRIKKSRTIQASFVLGMLGVVELNLHLIKDNIGEDNYGFVVLGISMLMFYLRTITTTPLEDKETEDK